jgi:DUF4097 and DUF4098 domain-containing protein YvlB
MTTVRTLRALLLIGALPLAASAQDRGDRIDTTLALSRGGQVDLGNVSGEIRVTGSDRRDVRIVASMERGRFELTASGMRIALRTKSEGNRQSSATIEVQVPTGTRVTASTVSGLVDVRSTQSEVVAKTVSGRVDVRGARDRVDAEAVSGDIELREVQGRINVEGVSANIYIDAAQGEVSSETVSGDTRITRSRLSGLRAESVSGDVSYEGNLDASGSYRMNTHSGGIGLTLPANVSATLELETFSGRINSEFPLTLQPGQATGRGRRMEFTLGNGGARVMAGAFSGNITIRRGAAAGDRE